MLLKQIIFTLIPLVILDGIWLFSMGPIFYKKFLGHLMSASPSWAPVVLFYILYAIGIAVFVTLPAFRANTSYWMIFLSGALLGLVAYGAYDFTNQATLRDWPVVVTIVDLAWGAILTGVVSVVSVYIGKLFS
jgi:uncharacterized membrane protein